MPPTNLAASLAELQGAVLRGEDRRSVIKAFHKTHNKHAGYLVALRTVNVAALLGGEVTESRMQLAELVRLLPPDNRGPALRRQLCGLGRSVLVL